MECDSVTNIENDEKIDPLTDIIDYLVRCVKISFKNSHINESEVRTADKIRIAYELYNRSPVEFLTQFGMYLTPTHVEYFEKSNNRTDSFRNCVKQLKKYHSDTSRHKRVRNRRYKALQKLQDETDYFSDKQMMFRNPLLYEQLVGQYLTDEEIKKRHTYTDSGDITFLNLILDTVDRNSMRELQHKQMLAEEINESKVLHVHSADHKNEPKYPSNKRWGEFDDPDTKPSHIPERRKQTMINAPERRLLYQEFLQEMYSSFIEGSDVDIDYDDIDNNDQYDDLEQASQDAEDKYFDSEQNDIGNLEEHMILVQEYGKKNDDNLIDHDDPLDIYMKHITK